MKTSLGRLLTVCILASLAPTLQAQRVIREFFGPGPTSDYGAALAVSPDADGDGVRELLVGAPGLDFGGLTDVGGAFLIAPNTGALLTQVRSVFQDSRFGTRVCAPGDLDGDGQVDIVMTAPLWQSGIGQGAALAFSRQGNLLWAILGDPYSRFGSSIAPIASIDNNNLADLLIGAPNNTNALPYGSVAAWSGQTTTRLTRVPGGMNSNMGAALVALGDMDGDGYTEVACGEPDFASNGMGMIMVLRSNLSGGTALRWSVPFLYQDNQLGTSLGNAGDLDGDGINDILAPSGSGALYLLSGSTGAILAQFIIPDLDASCPVTGIGDQNGDGVPEFAVGLPRANHGAGRVDVYDGASRARLYWIGGTANSRFGSALAALGDVDGDRRGDFAVGAPNYTTASGNAIGRVAIFGLTVPGELAVYGRGCAGSNGVPDLVPLGVPQPGQLAGVRLYQLPRQGLGFWLQGFSNTSSPLGPLPLDLGPLTGALGCSMLQSSEVATSFMTGNASYLSNTLVIPNSFAMVGVGWFQQALLLEPTRPGGLAVSNGVSVRIGNL